ncbi:MAG: DUF4271 domain-containing protein [Bacteroidota bacterium]
MSLSIKKYIIYLFAIFHAIAGIAQSSQNPFEIVDRLGEREIATPKNVEAIAVNVDTTSTVGIETPEADDPNSSEKIVALPNSDNPFEVKERPSQTAIAPTEKHTINNIATPAEEKFRPNIKKIEPAGKSTPHRGQFFIIMLITLIPMTLLLTVFRTHFARAYENVTNASALNRSYREFAGASIIPMNLWYLASWINLGIFLSLVMNYYEAAFTKSPLLNILICIGIVASLHLLKHLVLGLMAAIFPVNKEAKLYVFLLLLFGILIGVILVPMNIAIIYAADEMTKLLIFGALGLISTLYLIRAYRGLLVSGRLLALHKFHFLLYICVVELAPIFILIKLGLIYLGK